MLVVDRGGEDTLLGLLPEISALRRAVGFRVPEAELTVVTGIGSDLWDRLFAGQPRPAHLHRFVPLAGDTHSAPSTPGDLLFHIRAHRLDMCFEIAQHLTGRLRGAATVIDEVHGFKSFDERDMLGFVDGTENPEGDDAEDAVTIGAEDPPFAGGSYVIVQKYLHDLPAWDTLPVEQQERVIGRTKLSDIELPDGVQPSNSHVALTHIEDEDGDDLEIVRFNMPFGRVGAAEFGTYFIGYAADPGVTEQMLVNMFVGKPAGNHDRVLDFSTAVTGNLFFVPPADFLDGAVPPARGTVPHESPDDTPTPEPPSTTAAPDDDGSLSIGGLKGASP